MRFLTVLAVFAALSVSSAIAQPNEFIFDVPVDDDFTSPYRVGGHSGARSVTGPYDLDADGKVEILVTDYSGGGRVYVIENVMPDVWEVVWEMPFKDSTGTSGNGRVAVGGDLDGDGMGEIYVIGGGSYSENNPDIAALPFGIHGYEAVGDNDYGVLPATTYTFGEDVPNRLIPEMMVIADVDGDGIQELLLPNNGSGSTNDWFWILSVSGDIGSGFEFWVEEARISARVEDFDPVNRGGGSAYSILPADLNGDGMMDLSLHTWNNFNFTNGTVTGLDTYLFPDTSATDVFFKATAGDHVSLFGGLVVDIDQDGNDEVFYPRFQSGSDAMVSILNYNEGDDVLKITADNFGLDIIPGLSNFGLTAADIDGNGFIELIGTGSGYSGTNRTEGVEPVFARVVEYLGGDVMDPASYSAARDIFIGEEFDDVPFNQIVTDSAGVITTRYETTGGGAMFPTKIRSLGDADGDGEIEFAVSFQSVKDSYDIFDETFNPDSLTGQFNTPDGAAGPGAILPGDSYSFSFAAAEGSHVNFATMFVESNDLFYAAADTGIALFNGDGTMRSADVTGEIFLWDAGTELNEEPFVGPNQAPRQGAPGDGEPDTLGAVTICCDHDPWTYPATAEILTVVLVADVGTGIFTVTITNVSTAGKAAAVVPMAPGVYAISDGGTNAVFEEGSAASAGLKALAEDGINGLKYQELQDELGFFRTLRETVDVPVRSFARIFSITPRGVAIENDRIVVPSDYKLSANYPNPFNPSTSFSFTLPLDKQVSVKIYDMTGRLVKTLVDDLLHSAGTHEVSWDGRDASGLMVASGSYVYTLEYGNFRQSRNMVLLK